jgi:hypothetical protein
VFQWISSSIVCYFGVRVKQAERDSAQAANPDSKTGCRSVNKRPGSQRSKPGGKSAMGSQNQNIENLSGT